MMKARWTTDLTSTIHQDAIDIRFKVFVDEQKVPEELEVDDMESQTIHVVLYEDEKPVATARIYEYSDQTYKVQRVAVLEEARGKGHGAELMRQIELKVQELGGNKLTLGAQNTAMPFYEKLDYQVEGDEFMDAGIPHHTMTKKL